MKTFVQDISKPEHDMPTEHEILDFRSAVLRECAPQPDVESEWERLIHSLKLHAVRAQAARRRMVVWRWVLGIAASAAVLLLFFVFTDKPERSRVVRVFSADQAAQEVALTVGNGSRKIVKSRSVSFQRSPAKISGRMVTLVTPRGKDCQATLPDGTRVWMNADSKLVFPEAFAQKNRVVTLHGEAYFEVAKERGRRFEVRTDFFTTIVRGTTFNLRAYSAANANIVLIEGSVTISNGKEIRTIKSGEMACWQRDKSFTVTAVDTYSYLQWRNGFFYFDNQSLFEIMQELGRWYNVNIMFDDPRKMNVRLHFVANRKSKLEEAIRNMNELGVVHIEQEHGTVVIK